MNDKNEELTILQNAITPFDSSEEKFLKLRNKFAQIDYNQNRKLECEKCLERKSYICCPNYNSCPYIQSYIKTYKKENFANTVMNKFEDFTEVCFYKSDFYVASHIQNVSTDVDRSRKWIKNENGILVPKADSAKIEKLQNCLINSRKRALDNLFGYVLCNKWDYFVTVTFKHGKFKKLSDELVKYQWQKFRQQLQYKYPDIKILLVPEDTPTGNHGMHFHGFIGNADIGEYLCPARNNDKKSINYGDFLYTKYGDPIFNFMKKLTNVGFTTVVKLKDNNRLKLVNYMTKYMHKDSSNFDYNENSYLHTYNLNFKDKQLANFSVEEKKQLIENLSAVFYKETDKMIVYRIFKNI